MLIALSRQNKCVSALMTCTEHNKYRRSWKQKNLFMILFPDVVWQAWLAVILYLIGWIKPLVFLNASNASLSVCTFALAVPNNICSFCEGIWLICRFYSTNALIISWHWKGWKSYQSLSTSCTNLKKTKLLISNWHLSMHFSSFI